MAYSKSTFNILSISGRVYMFVSYVSVVLIFLTENTFPGQLTDAKEVCTVSTSSALWRFVYQTFKGLNRTDIVKQSQFLTHGQQPLSRTDFAVGFIVEFRSPTAENNTASASYIFHKSLPETDRPTFVNCIRTTQSIFITYLVSELLIIHTADITSTPEQKFQD